MCRKQPGIAIGRLCDKCDGKCPVCDSYVRPTTLVRICDECSFGNYQNKCAVCGGEGISDAFYCFECTRLEKDRDGCPKIINLGSSRTDVRHSSLSVLLPLLGRFADLVPSAVVLPEKDEPSTELLTTERPGSGHASWYIASDQDDKKKIHYYMSILLLTWVGVGGVWAKNITVAFCYYIDSGTLRSEQNSV